MRPLVNEQQARAFKQLSDAYNALSQVWDSSGGYTDWNGLDSLGGALDEAGLLPTISLDEASRQLEELYQHHMLLLTGLDVIRNTFYGFTEWESTDDNYHYYITTHEGKGNMLHRIAWNDDAGLYSIKCDIPGDDWANNEHVTNEVQMEHGKLFPNREDKEIDKLDKAYEAHLERLVSGETGGRIRIIKD